MRIYLVQRATLKEKDPKQVVGVNELLELDYMGASEFEWGAPAKSLRRCYEKLDKLKPYIQASIRKGDQPLHLVCLPEQREEITGFIAREVLGLAQPRQAGQFHYLHEPTYLQEAVAGTSKINCWWDIENDWFALFGDAKLITVALAASKKRTAEKDKQKGKK